MNRWRKKLRVATMALVSTNLLGAAGCGTTTAEPSPTPDGSVGSAQGGAAGMGGMGAMGAMGGMGAMGAMGGEGGIKAECIQPSDCGMDTVCVTHTCTNGSCGKTYANAGIPWDTQTPGDCKLRVCNGQGAPTDQNDATDVPNDTSDCTLDQCSNGLPENVLLAVGTGCASDGGKVCNTSGVCVECVSALDCASKLCVNQVCLPASCGDKVQNGNETDKDCGGNACAPCVNGKVCQVSSDCESGVCDMVGKCAVPNCADGAKNGDETDVDCGGTCTGCGLGAACNVNGDCMSSYCVGSVCVDAICGDGIVTGSEVCDDGNLNAGDCCNGCQLEVGTGCEIEVNDTVPTANHWNAVAKGGRIKAFNNPPLDKDVFRIDVPVPVTGKLTAEVLDGPLGTTCASGDIDSYLSLRNGAGTVLGADDDGGTGFCSSLTVTNLAPGSYYLEQKRTPVGAGGLATYDYALEVTFSVCGDNVTDSNEGCDDGNVVAGDGCSSVCAVEAGYVCVAEPSVCAPVCGDGFKTGMETCDDGNVLSGDCCSSSCQAVANCEIEPNNTDATANEWNLVAFNNIVKAFNAPTDDVDIFKIDVPLGMSGTLKAEVLDGPLGTTCASYNLDSFLTIRSAAGVTLGTDDDTGLGFCSLLTVASLASGPYYVEHKHSPSNPNGLAMYDYRLRLTLTLSPCGDGVIVSPELCDDGNLVNGDGCSATCSIEPFYNCVGMPSVCTLPETICNDGVDNDGDGTTDGADSNCTLPPYFQACAAGQLLRVYKSPSLNVMVPDFDPTGITHTLTIPNIGTIARVAMLYNITHTWDADIELTLMTPGGTLVDVCSDNGPGGANFVNTILDSMCTTTVTGGVAPFSNCYKPETALTSLVGTSAQGTWTIKVVDDESQDVGTFQDWALIFCITP